MATLKFHLRFKRGKERKYYYIRSRAGQNLGAGYDKDAAEKMLVHFTALEVLRKNGVPIPTRSGWTIGELRDYDLKVATREGMDVDTRRRRWSMIVSVFDEKSSVEAITRERLGDFVSKRRDMGAGIATIRRDLSVLKTALELARDPESGAEYSGDPFAGMKSSARKEREARAKTPKFRPELVEAVIAAAWKEAAEKMTAALDAKYKRRRQGVFGRRMLIACEWRQNAQMIELTYLTKSRPEQIQELRRDQIRMHPNAAKGIILWFAPHKRGTERFFFYTGRIREILEGIPDEGSEYFFSSRRGDGLRETPRRRFLQRAIARAMKELQAAGTPAPELAGLTLRSLRKSKACADLAAGKLPGAVQSELGHQSLATTLAWYAEVFPHVGLAEWPVAPSVTAQQPKEPKSTDSNRRKSRDSRGNTRGARTASTS